jgi:hypothetical protein
MENKISENRKEYTNNESKVVIERKINRLRVNAKLQAEL